MMQNKISLVIRFVFIFFLCIGFNTVYAQKTGQAALDSMIRDLGSDKYANKEDTFTVKLLGSITSGYQGIDPEKGIKYGLQGVELANKLGWKFGIYKLNLNLGTTYYRLANYPAAMSCYVKALKTSEEIGFQLGICYAASNIAVIYNEQEDFLPALEYYTRALKVSKELNDKYSIAATSGNIGSVYVQLKQYDKALECFTNALTMSEELHDTGMVAKFLTGRGVIHALQKNYVAALEYYFKSMELSKKNGDVYTTLSALMDIGDAYSSMVSDSTYMSSKTRAERSLLLQKAIDYTQQGLVMCKELNAQEGIKKCYLEMAKIYKLKGDYKTAMEYSDMHYALRDSIYSQENAKKIMQQQIQYTYDKKEAVAKAEQEKKDLLQRNIRNSTLAGMGGLLIFSVIVYRQRNKVKKEKAKVEVEKARSDELLLNILPDEVAEELKTKGSAEAKLIDEVTVLFTDFKDFTKLSEQLSPKELVAEIDECFSSFDHIMQKHGVEKIKTIGDSYMAAGGLPTPNSTHPENVINAALEIQQYMHEHKIKKEQAGKLFFEIRIGVHTGPVVAGIVGIKKFAYDIWGDTVNTASRMESSGAVGQVNISGTTYEKVKDKFKCTYRGELEAKNKGKMGMYFVERLG